MHVSRGTGLWIATIGLFAGLSLAGGCSDDDKTTEPVDDEFVAGISDLQGYRDWNRTDYTTYPTNAEVLGPAHVGNDSSFARTVYQNNDVVPATDGSYPDGTIIVKEVFQFDGSGNQDFTNGNVVAMSKRGGEFNPDHEGWEWLMLTPGGNEILARGADLLSGACNSCHSLADDGAAGEDYVFDHPAESVVQSGSEWNFFASAIDSWARVDSAFGPDPFLASAHGINDDFNREVFRWQPAGRADADRFPIGTALLKVVSKPGEGGVREYPDAGGWTAMVKRGGDFDSSNGDWEWFVLDPNTQTLSARGNGASVFDGACAGCHSQATGANGADRVFTHPGLGN